MSAPDEEAVIALKRFLDTFDWLCYEATDEEYWAYYRAIKGWPVPKRPQDSWWDRFKARHFHPQTEQKGT